MEVWHRGIVAEWQSGSVMVWHCGSVAVLQCDSVAGLQCRIVAPWFRGIVASWHHGTVASWQCGRLAGLQSGTVTVWQCGRVAVWQGLRVAGWQCVEMETTHYNTNSRNRRIHNGGNVVSSTNVTLNNPYGKNTSKSTPQLSAYALSRSTVLPTRTTKSSNVDGIVNQHINHSTCTTNPYGEKVTSPQASVHVLALSATSNNNYNQRNNIQKQHHNQNAGKNKKVEPTTVHPD